MMSSNPRPILLVEDDEDDVFIFTRAFKRTKLPHPLRVVRDGRQALNYLLGEGEFTDREKHPFPAVVFLDLKLPLKSGLEVLDVIRSQRSLARVGAVVLTSSAEPRDIRHARRLGAHAYLVKPPTADVVAAAIAACEAQRDTTLGRIPAFRGDLFNIALRDEPPRDP